MFQGNYCLTVGTNLSESISEDQCVCLNKTNEGYFNYAGRHCDIPESIWTQNGGNSFFSHRSLLFIKCFSLNIL
jgi:hypothetical protein